LDLSKVEAGKMELYLETFEIQPVIEGIVSAARPLIDKNNNRLVIACPPDIGRLHADLTRLRQILYNLLSNACKFTENGVITLSVFRQERGGQSMIHFSFADTGIGMTAEQMAIIFDEFTQADVSTTRKFGGTGLGLAISRRFCQMMGGDIEVQSSLNQGSTFTVYLPGAPLPLPLPAPSRPLRAGTKVLIVDDDPDMHKMMSDYLQKEGLTILSATHGRQGYELAKTQHPAVILLDILMPDMDGWGVLALLKADALTAGIPVIILSMIEDRQTGYTLGASEYLTKPVDGERLIGLLKHYTCAEPPCPVLIVEDDANTRLLLRDMLRADGWSVTEAENGRIGLEKMRQNRPQLILLDLMMPEMNGFEFREALRAHEEWSSIPIIIITAMDLTPEERDMLNSDFVQIVQKGQYSRDQLLHEVYHHMQRVL
jgi:CheY-like chemotaxis protein